MGGAGVAGGDAGVGAFEGAGFAQDVEGDIGGACGAGIGGGYDAVVLKLVDGGAQGGEHLAYLVHGAVGVDGEGLVNHLLQGVGGILAVLSRVAAYVGFLQNQLGLAGHLVEGVEVHGAVVE